jgi:polyisoprenyl-phosphate glycosyltransferase
MDKPRTISIVVPVFWNEESLVPLSEELGRVEEELGIRNYNLELIFVDDGSGDDSLGELLKIKKSRPATKVIKLTRNFGAVHACKTGLSFVTGDCFLILAADLQDPPELIPAMITRWQAGCKFVVCARTNRKDPLMSKLFSHLYYRLLRLFVVKDYPEGGFDLALMDRALLPYLQDCSKNINPALFAYWLGFAPEIIHYVRRERLHGRSRWTFAKKVKFFLDSILGFSIVPIRLISLLGLAVSLCSFSYGFLVFVSRLLGRGEVPGFATIVALIAFLLGMVIVMLGIIGEYLWRIFDETNKRPEAVIDEIY